MDRDAYDHRDRDSLIRLRDDLDATLSGAERVLIVARGIVARIMTAEQSLVTDSERVLADRCGIGHLVNDRTRSVNMAAFLGAIIAQEDGLERVSLGLRAWLQGDHAVGGRWVEDLPDVAEVLPPLLRQGTPDSILTAGIALTAVAQKNGVDGLWKTMLDWIVTGEDATDPASAGGLNAEELQRFITICEDAGWVRPAAPDASLV